MESVDRLREGVANHVSSFEAQACPSISILRGPDEMVTLQAAEAPLDVDPENDLAKNWNISD